MGISGLMPFLDETGKWCQLNEFRGCSVAVDAYCLLHRGAFYCADQLVKGDTTTAYVKYCMKYVNLLLSFRIKPIMVFDGQGLAAKKITDNKRHDEAKRLYRQCIDITHTMALQIIQECRNKNVDCIVAPYEADAQLAYLNLHGIVDFVITEDSDLVVFGCTKILFKLDLLGNGMLFEKENLIKAMKMRPDMYTFAKFRHMCILSGCGYVEPLPGFNLKQAHKAVCITYDNIDQLLLNLPIKITPEYSEQFKIADTCFQHQIVYDPHKRQLVHLTPPEAPGIRKEYLKGPGLFYHNANAYQLALGNIDPITYKILDTWNPDDDDNNNIPSTSIWSKTYTKQESKPIQVSKDAIMAGKQRIIDFENKLPEPVVAETQSVQINLTEEKQIAAGEVVRSNYFKTHTEDHSLQLDNENSINQNHTVSNNVPKPETIVRVSENQQNNNNNNSLMEFEDNELDISYLTFAYNIGISQHRSTPISPPSPYSLPISPVLPTPPQESKLNIKTSEDKILPNMLTRKEQHEESNWHETKIFIKDLNLSAGTSKSSTVVPKPKSPDNESITHVPLNANTPVDEKVTVGNYQLDKGGLLSNDENIEDNAFTAHSLLSHTSERAPVSHKRKRSHKRKFPEQSNKITDMLPYIKKKRD